MSDKTAAAKRRLRAFVDAYRKMSGLDPDDVYAVSRDGEVFTLRLSDLELVLYPEATDDES